MDLTNGDVWFAIALAFIAALITNKAARARTMVEPVCNSPPPPPVVSCGSIIGMLHTLFTKGLQAMAFDLYTKLGSVFTISFVGVKLTFLVGPEVSDHFYQGPHSEVSPNMHGFTVPMIGKGVGYDLDARTQNEQNRFFSGAFKASNLINHVGPMLQEVQGYFAKWGQQGTVDLRQELEHLLTLITGRCLIGKEVREKMFDEFFTLFHEMVDNGMHLTSVVFPYGPTPMNRRRDRARAKLAGILTEIVRSRKSSNQIEEDTLQNLIDSKYKDGRPTTESEVTGMIIALLLAGKHSSSMASTWTGACLLSHKSFLEAAVMEQKQIIRKYGYLIDYKVLMEMDTLHCCIKEALRMHPPAPGLFRKVHKDFIVRTKEGDMYKIPRGHTIISPILLNSNIPSIYKDPHMYDPERFGHAREEDKAGGKFSYTSFGGGRHACLGELYAYMQGKVIWSYLLRNFELKMVSPFPQTNWSKLVPEPKGKVMVTYNRRLLPST